jgi:hypothetical protein
MSNNKKKSDDQVCLRVPQELKVKLREILGPYASISALMRDLLLDFIKNHERESNRKSA